MHDQQLHFFQDWFQHYVLSLRETEPLHQRSLDMKQTHTIHVQAAIDQIATGLNLSENHRRIASVTALFHDLGRFPQYKKYRTFRDPDSENHARLSIRELNHHRVLHGLDLTERRLIHRAIFLHNRLRLPDDLDPNSTLHCRLIRDADKVDILRVMVEHFQTETTRRNPVISLELENESVVRGQVYRCLFRKQAMNYTDLRSADELKVLQMSWVFDIHFRPTFEMLRQSKFLDRLAATMPDTPLRREAIAFVNDHIETRLETK